MKKLFFLLLAMSTCLFAHAQLGINVNSPNKRSMLDIKSDDGDPKGVLFPRLTPTVINQLRNNLNSFEQSGMMVYDSESQFLFIMKPVHTSNTISFQKHIVDPWKTTTSEHDNFNIRLSDSIKKIGVGTNDPQEQVHLTKTLRSKQLKTSVLSNEEATDEGSIQLIGNLESNQTIIANTFVGHGTIPVGGIIMWSGKLEDIPDGWALCDGQTNLRNGEKVPDLSGRFIVSHKAGKYEVGTTGGADSVRLTVEQMPSHSHELEFEFREQENAMPKDAENIYPFDNYLSNQGTEVRELYDPNINVLGTGGGLPHENRPSYYVLAFIMRIK